VGYRTPADIQNVLIHLLTHMLLFSSHFAIDFLGSNYLYIIFTYTGADPGFVVKGGVSMRGVLGP
jgi:hypothetical protein